MPFIVIRLVLLVTSWPYIRPEIQPEQVGIRAGYRGSHLVQVRRRAAPPYLDKLFQSVLAGLFLREQAGQPQVHALVLVGDVEEAVAIRDGYALDPR